MAEEANLDADTLKQFEIEPDEHEEDIEELNNIGDIQEAKEEDDPQEDDGEIEAIEDEIIDEDEAPKEEQEEPQEEVEEKPKSNDKLLLIVAVVLGLLVVILLIVVIYFSLSKDANVEDETKEIVAKIDQYEEKIEPDMIEKMIAEANYLYKQGKREQALEIFEKVSRFNNSISLYNLGVTQMGEKKYSEALENFKKSIANESNRCASAINAAVCALNLKDKKLFDYYINLAYSYLPNESDTKLYEYYYGLIMYYKKMYPEAISALTKKEIQAYKYEQNHLISNIYLNLQDTVKSINHLEKDADENDLLTLGLMYAQVGEYKNAIENLQRALQLGQEPAKTNLALGLCYLKIGQMQAAFKNIKDAHSLDEINSSQIYPIEVKLKESLFDINNAQKNFLNELNLNTNSIYDIFFYFAPYKILNPNQTLNYIKKGNKNSYINSIQAGQDGYKKGSFIAELNEKMANGIKQTLSFKIRDANKTFQDIETNFPNDSYLLYNLALSYAQLGLYPEAFKYFRKSYNLDKTNFLSGIFMIVSAKLSNLRYKDFIDPISSDFTNNLDETKDEDKFYKALFSFIRGDGTAVATEWMATNKFNTPISKAFEIVLASAIDDQQLQIQKSNELVNLTSNDIISNILNFYSLNKDQHIKEFAAKAQTFIRRKGLNLDSLYYGPKSAKEMYIKLAHISGMLFHVRDILRERVITEKYDTRGILQALAYTDIYLNFFEEGYSIYTKLIDELGENDSYTTFLASVAAIGAQRHSQAIILLELANIEHPLNYESRYALGLLYQEALNLEAASIQFQNINAKDFQSQFFDFNIYRDKSEN